MGKYPPKNPSTVIIALPVVSDAQVSSAYRTATAAMGSHVGRLRASGQDHERVVLPLHFLELTS